MEKTDKNREGVGRIDLPVFRQTFANTYFFKVEEGKQSQFQTLRKEIGRCWSVLVSDRFWVFLWQECDMTHF